MNPFAAIFLVTWVLFQSSPKQGIPSANEVADTLKNVKQIHGAAGPWAVVGYRMGQKGLSLLELPTQSHRLMVVHRGPAEVQFSCMADGLQAATGASLGKLNLKFEEAKRENLSSIIQDQKTGRQFTFKVKASLAKSILNLPFESLEDAGKRVAALPDDEIFEFSETTNKK